jgi:hypothetical protein
MPDTATPAELEIVRLFVYPFHAAPTEDLVDLGVSVLQAGATRGAVIDYLLSLAPAPFLAPGSSNVAFVTSLVESYCHGSGIDSSTRSQWVQELLPAVASFETRGAFIDWVNGQIDAYSGTDASLLELKGVLAERMTIAATWRATAAGQVYDGGSWTELQAVLEPAPEPTYSLSVNADQIDEGGSVTFTLGTTHVAAGTVIPFNVSGSGISLSDFSSGALAGQLTVGSDGKARITFTAAADALTEGPETFTMTVGDAIAAHSVAIGDISTTPPPPTYALAAGSASVNEGSSVTFILSTTGLVAGTQLAYTLSGTGITAADIDGGLLTGKFTVDNDGIDEVIIAILADQLTEGAETLKLTLDGRATMVETSLADTSTTPPPTGRPDTLVIADDMDNSNASDPADADEGELRIETYLTFDLLRQTSTTALRMTLNQLRATSSDAGAPLVTTNRSADRGNIPQVSNQDLNTFDLGLDTDLVDYSAEQGRIVAVISDDAPSTQQLVMVNDDDTDDSSWDDETDRIDTLRNVEKIAASRGGGVLDLTNSGGDWELRFSHQFDAEDDVLASLDRAVHVVRIGELDSGNAYARSYLEYRDAGLVSTTQAKAIWAEVQGSDHDERVVFSAFESTDDRSLSLRGGDNEVRYSDLTRSILVAVDIDPWVASASLADDTNASGVVTATTLFTNGDGATLLGATEHVTMSHTPDNRIAAGTLLVAASQDREDAISFGDIAQAKVVSFAATGGGVSHGSLRLAGGPNDPALEFSGFEIVHDNGTSDDLYVVDDIDDLDGDDPKLTDGGASDHDGIALGDHSIGADAVGGDDEAIKLVTINAELAFDFDVLDLSALTDDNDFAVSGTAGTDDELVLGDLLLVDAVTQFEAIVLTSASFADGDEVVLNLDAGRVEGPGDADIQYGGTVLGAGGLFFIGSDQASTVSPVSRDVTLTIIDTSSGAGGTLRGGSGDDDLLGGAGNDTLRGGDGDDALLGGDADSDTFVFEASGSANGSDQVDEFTAGGDNLDVTAFTGTAITTAAPAIDADDGGTFAGLANTAEFIFNRAGGKLAAADFATASSDGKFVLANNRHVVVAVTSADTVDGGDDPIRLYYVVNGPVTGIADLTVSLIATIRSDADLTLADVFDALS